MGGWERRERVRGVGGVVKLMKQKETGGGHTLSFTSRFIFYIYDVITWEKRKKGAANHYSHTHTHTHTHRHFKLDGIHNGGKACERPEHHPGCSCVANVLLICC